MRRGLVAYGADLPTEGPRSPVVALPTDPSRTPVRTDDNRAARRRRRPKFTIVSRSLSERGAHAQRQFGATETSAYKCLNGSDPNKMDRHGITFYGLKLRFAMEPKTRQLHCQGRIC